MSSSRASNVFPYVNYEQPLSKSFSHVFSLILHLGRPCIVCFRVPLEKPDVKALLSLHLVEGIVLAAEDRDLLAEFPNRLGFFSRSGSDWQLPAKLVSDLIYVGPWTDFGARVAWRAWQAGIIHIHRASVLKQNSKRGVISVVIEKILRSLLYRLWQSSMRREFAETSGLAFRLEEYLTSRRLGGIKDSPLPIPDLSIEWMQGKVVFVCGTLGPGGAERQLTATMLGLVSRGHTELHFLHHSTLDKPNDFFLPNLIAAGVSYSQVNLIGTTYSSTQSRIDEELRRRLAPLGDLGEVVAAYAKEFLSHKPQIVHLWLDHTNVVAGLAALLVGVPRIVLSCRSLSPENFAFNQPFMRPIYQLMAQFPHVTFLNNSEAGASDYRRWLGVASLKIQVIQNGFDFSALPTQLNLPQLRSEYRRQVGIPSNVPVLGVIMRFSEEKRPLLWIEIARKVAQKVPETHFLMVGNGPMREQIEEVGNTVLPEKIHFPGQEQNAFLAMASMDIFMLTSRIEGLPNVLIESQALGILTVAIDVGGVKETMIDSSTGWLLKDSDASSAAEKIVELLSNQKAYKNASLKAREFAHSNFDLNRMVEKTLSVYGFPDKN